MMNLPRRLLYLVLLATAVRMIIAGTLELSNDEVYYFLYALDPQPNYFDHPPGVGVLIRLFTFNLWLTHEFFVRLGAIVCAIIGTILVYNLGTLLKNERTGWYAAILYNSSIYTSLIAGTFIIPDSPQVVFWLAALWVSYKILLQAEKKQAVTIKQWVLFGFLTGLCAMCKVHGVFLWFGFGLFILFYQRSLLREPGLYLSALVALVVVSPILWWNIQNDFITYKFHSDRVAVQESIFHFDYLAQSIGGQILYNNPINAILILISIWKVRSMNIAGTIASRFILLNGVPIIAVVTFMSLFNSMLPHWSGPGFMVLGFLAAAYLDEISVPARMPSVIMASVFLILLGLVAAMALILWYPGTIGSHERARYGDGDFTLVMYGWKQFSNQFGPWIEEQQRMDSIPANIKIVSHKWFPAAHLDYYVASPLNIPLVGVGKVTDLHQYFWLNKLRTPLKRGENALCIVPTNNPVNMEQTYLSNFSSANLLHFFENTRNGVTARYFEVYLLKDYQLNDEVHSE